MPGFEEILIVDRVEVATGICLVFRRHDDAVVSSERAASDT